MHVLSMPLRLKLTLHSERPKETPNMARRGNRGAAQRYTRQQTPEIQKKQQSVRRKSDKSVCTRFIRLKEKRPWPQRRQQAVLWFRLLLQVLVQVLVLLLLLVLVLVLVLLLLLVQVLLLLLVQVLALVLLLVVLVLVFQVLLVLVLLLLLLLLLVLVLVLVLVLQQLQQVLAAAAATLFKARRCSSWRRWRRRRSWASSLL